MGDLSNTLIDTMKYPSTPKLTGDTEKDIGTFQQAYHPGMTQAFSQVMQTVARMAYNDRQQVEMNQLNKQFDPTKVSGGTFSSIMNWVEQNRGIDTSKVYQATMQGYQASQQEIGTQLERMKGEQKEKEDEYRSLMYQFPDAGIKRSDDAQTIASKIKKSNERKVVVDLYTQTFGYLPDLSVAEMNKKLAKKYKEYDKVKQQLELALSQEQLAKAREVKDEETGKQEKDRTKYLDDLIAEAKKGNYGGTGKVDIENTKRVKDYLKNIVKQYYPGWEWVVDKELPNEYPIPDITKKSDDWG